MPGVPYTTGQVVGASDLNSMSGGTLGYAQITANSGTAASTPLVVAGLSTTVTQSAGRRLRITGWANAIAAGGTYPNTGHMYIYSGAAQIQAAHVIFGAASNILMEPKIVLGNVASGSVTYYVYISIDNGTIGVVASPTQPAWILVEDIGT